MTVLYLPSTIDEVIPPDESIKPKLMDVFLTTMQILALTVAGMCHALLGSVKVPLAKKLQINEDKVGGLLSAFGFTTIPMAFAAGIFELDQGTVQGKLRRPYLIVK